MFGARAVRKGRREARHRGSVGWHPHVEGTVSGCHPLPPVDLIFGAGARPGRRGVGLRLQPAPGDAGRRGAGPTPPRPEARRSVALPTPAEPHATTPGTPSHAAPLRPLSPRITVACVALIASRPPPQRAPRLLFDLGLGRRSFAHRGSGCGREGGRDGPTVGLQGQARGCRGGRPTDVAPGSHPPQGSGAEEQ